MLKSLTKIPDICSFKNTRYYYLKYAKKDPFEAFLLLFKINHIVSEEEYKELCEKSNFFMD
jgi:hypothetical protein